MSFIWDIKIQGFGPFSQRAGGIMQLNSSRVAMYSGNGQGKTCISRLFRAAELGPEKLPEHFINRSCNNGDFSFVLREQGKGDKTLSVALTHGGVASIKNETGYLFHVFNSDYVRENLADAHYSPSDEGLNGYILGKENIDVSEKKKRLDDLSQLGQKKRDAIDQTVKEARRKLAELKLSKLKAYKEFTTDKILSLDVGEHNYDSCLSELQALNDLPDNVPALSGLSLNADCANLESIKTILQTAYSKDAFTDEFINEVSPKRSFIETGLELLTDDVCPFCGTQFNDNARALINAYNAYVQGQEAKIASAIDEYVRGLESLKGAYKVFAVTYQGRNNWFIRLKPAFPEFYRKKLPIIPTTDEFDSTIDAVINLLNKKAENISSVQDCGSVEALDEKLANISNAIARANSTLSTLNQKVSNSSHALTTARQRLCAEMAKRVRHECDSLITERDALANEYAQLRDEINAEESRSRKPKRDAVAETLATMIHAVFGNKYTFDPELFTVKLGNTALRDDADGVMSDGEKSVLAFCHYVASTWNLLDIVDDSENLFFVIDDPISSMDFHYVYNVAQIIKDLGKTFSFSRVRFLLMTHNTAFFNLLARNKVARGHFTLHNGCIEPCKKAYLAPYGEHLKDLYKVASNESQPTHTTGNSIRQVIETLWRFDDPAAENLETYLQTPRCSDLIECEYIYTICQDLSHGATPFDREQPPDVEAVKRACRAVICHVHNLYPGQLDALNIGFITDDKSASTAEAPD